MPGVPDFYQGTEFWDLSLVDPDNRRPVDFAARAAALASLETPDWAKLVQNWPNGHLKLAWTRHLLKLRTELGRRVRRRRLPAAASERTASRPRHRLCAAAWPRRRDRRGRQIIRAVHRKAAGPGRAAKPLMARSTSSGYSVEALPSDELRLSAALPASAGRGAEGEIHRRAEAGAKARSRCEPETRKAARDRRPDGLADVVPTTKVGSLLRACIDGPENSLPTSLRNLPLQIFRRCKAQQIACISRVWSAADCRDCGSRPAPLRQIAATATAASTSTLT